MAMVNLPFEPVPNHVVVRDALHPTHPPVAVKFSGGTCESPHAPRGNIIVVNQFGPISINSIDQRWSYKPVATIAPEHKYEGWMWGALRFIAKTLSYFLTPHRAAVCLLVIVCWLFPSVCGELPVTHAIPPILVEMPPPPSRPLRNRQPRPTGNQPRKPKSLEGKTHTTPLHRFMSGLFKELPAHFFLAPIVVPQRIALNQTVRHKMAKGSIPSNCSPVHCQFGKARETPE